MIALTLLFILFVSVKLNPVSAADVSTVPWGNRYFEPPRTNGRPGFIPFNQIFSPLQVSGNSANVIKSGQYDVGVEVNPQQAWQSGAMWSDAPIVDLSSSAFQASMNLFFGNVPVNFFSNPGDGMTFALTGVKPTVIGNNGASIGVWGSQEASAATGAANDAKTLKKSFVVAFDTYPNQNELDHSIWPSGGGPVRQYLAHGYPNQPSAYTTFGIPFIGSRVALDFPADAITKVPNNLADNAWHAFNVSWQRDADNGGGTLTYQFSTGGNLGLISKNIHWSNADVTRIFGTSKLYMGFTGSTGLNTEANVVSFRSIPGIVSASGEVELYKNNQVVTANTGLQSNDRVNYQYDLHAMSDGKQSWPISGTLTAVLSKASGISYLNTNGTRLTLGQTMPITATVGNTTVTLTAQLTALDTLTVTGIPQFPQGRDVKLSFTIPGQVDAMEPGIPPQQVKAQTGTVYGDNAQLIFETATADKLLSYQLIAPNKEVTQPEVPDGDLTLDSVPSFSFKKADGTNLSVADIFNQRYPGVANLMTDRSQWLLQQNTAQLKSIIVTDARNQSPGWNLSVEMGPFINKVTQQPLEQHPDDAGTAMIQMIMRNNVTTNTQLSYRIRDIHQVVPVTSAPPATKTGQNSVNISAAAAGIAIKRLPHIMAGTYTAQLTWMLATTPTG
ncbi:lectin-like domain-containing protein [Lacticaseibacillus saniviri]|uniref:WxL domain-containing protein n=1 Tax=Lacticaseibacillus saniviri TaxID=931533 RepID=UPI001EDF7DEB|nr:WxL domain-containing protein [Lacticaseibacillus saniviri]MCG4281846.1 WxL domain-containing protein [Lacticaseibacillus saniviri]